MYGDEPRYMKEAYETNQMSTVDENIFCSDMTFNATVNSIVYEGGLPVFIDSEYETWYMDPDYSCLFV